MVTGAVRIRCRHWYTTVFALRAHWYRGRDGASVVCDGNSSRPPLEMFASSAQVIADGSASVAIALETARHQRSFEGKARRDPLVSGSLRRPGSQVSGEM